MFNWLMPKTQLPQWVDEVGCLGKLPLYAEFIHCNVQQGLGLWLDQWCQQAYLQICQRYGVEHKTLFSRMPLQAMLIYTGSTRLPLIGILAASKDSSHRAYPFVMFRLLQDAIANEFPATIPGLFQRYYHYSVELHQRAGCDGTNNDILSAISDSAKVHSNHSRTTALAMTLNELRRVPFQALLHSFPGRITASQLVAALKIVHRKISDYMRDKGCFICCFPLIRHDILASVLFWLQWLEYYLKKFPANIYIFWPHRADENPEQLTLFFNKLPPQALCYLLDPSIKADHCIDVRRLINLDAEECLQCDPDLSLYDALQYVSERLPL